MHTVLFIGGRFDGRTERLRDLAPMREVLLPSKESCMRPLSDPVALTTFARQLYELDQFRCGDDKRLFFYRLNTLSAYDAMALLMAGYKKP